MTIKNVTLEDFDSLVGFWSGAKDRWDDYNEEQKAYLEEIASECEFDTLTQVNDFVWFDADDLLAEAGLMDEE